MFFAIVNKVKKLVSPEPTVSCRSAQKLGSYLVCAKVYPVEPKIGSCHCGKKRCQVCLNVTEADSFTICSTNETCKINYLFNFSEKCLVHLLTCWVCFEKCVDQTIDEFRKRWNNDKSNDRKYLNRKPCFQENIFEHFNIDGLSGFLENFSITYIDKTDTADPEKQENYWIQALRTMAPWGLNVLVRKESVSCKFFGTAIFREPSSNHTVFSQGFTSFD